MSQLALTVMSIAIATMSAAPADRAAPPATTQSEQDHRDYEAYEAALKEVNAEADKTARSRAELEGSYRPTSVLVSATTPVAQAARTAAVATATAPVYAAAPATVSVSSASRPTPASLSASTGTPAVAMVASRPSASAASAGGSPAGCSLFEPGFASVPTAKCMQCHGLSRTHPVDLDYAATIQRNPAFMYRPVEEVIRRGVFLPNGQVACVTCHDANSPWQDRIALPPGTTARPAVDPRKRETYAPLIQTAAAASLPAHSAVTPTPLCQACHTYGD